MNVFCFLSKPYFHFSQIIHIDGAMPKKRNTSLSLGNVEFDFNVISNTEFHILGRIQMHEYNSLKDPVKIPVVTLKQALNYNTLIGKFNINVKM